MIKKLIVALALGCGVAALMVERDQWACMRVGDKFKEFFSTTYNCSIKADVEQVTLFNPSLVLRNVVVTAPDGVSWQWKASRLSIGFSLRQFLMYGVMSLYVHLDNLSTSASSPECMQGLYQHIMTLMTGGISVVMSRMDEVIITNAAVAYENAEQQLVSNLCAQYTMRRIDGVVRSQLTLTDGAVTVGNVPCVEKIHGSVQVDSQYDAKKSSYDVQGEVACVMSRLPAGQRECFVRCLWKDGKGDVSLVNADRSLVSDQIILSKNEKGFVVDATMRGTCEHLAACFGLQNTALYGGDVVGSVALQVRNGTYDATLQAVGSRCSYAGMPLADTVTISGKKEGDTVAGDCAITCGKNMQAAGTWHYAVSTGSGALQMSNITTCVVPVPTLWSLAPGDCTVDVTRNVAGVITGAYRCVLQQPIQKNSVQGSGSFTLDATQAQLDGAFGSLRYKAEFAVDPVWQLRSVHCVDDVGQSLLTARSMPLRPTHIKAAVHVPFIRTLVGALFDYDVQGTGVVTIDVQRGSKTTQADIRLNQATVRLPHLYNVVNGARAHITYDHAQRIFTASEVTCALHKGTITMNNAVVHHDDKGNLVHWYIPVTLKNCLINSKQDFFASVSGHVTGSYTAGALPHVAGVVLLERSQVKENIFSEKFQQRLTQLAESTLVSTGPDATCDVRVETVAPLRVQTPFLEADAQLAFKLSNTARDPHIAGSLTILSGSLLFPYRPLHITKGIITMVAQQPRDPLIELVAQNQVRNHEVSMHVTGSLSQHYIMFESAPTLTEEQIIALLLVGSEDESLNIVMPTLIMQNLASLVFGDDTSSSRLDRYFKKFMKPFKNIHITPRLSDQSSRGGLRGALDIEVNDRWRALIQKNFSLTEDTRFELEYQASDDVGVRLIRDEHRDMGAEVEMKWKF